MIAFQGFVRAVSYLLSLCLLTAPSLPFSAARALRSREEQTRIFACGNRAERTVALTFDDGPHPVYTDRILEVLDRYGIRATFFVIGKNVEQYPEVFERVVSRGHSIGSHTYSHAHIGRIGEAQLIEEYEKNDALLKERGVSTRLFRPPEGVCDGKVKGLASKRACDVILWSIDTGDWRGTSADRIVMEVLDHACGGEIVLMHDYISGRGHTAEALEKLIPELLRKGFEFVTVGELLGREE